MFKRKTAKRYWYHCGGRMVTMTNGDLPMPLPWVEITEEMFWDFFSSK